MPTPARGDAFILRTTVATVDTIIGGFTTKTFSESRDSIETTSKDDAGNRTLIAGIYSASITGSGIFVNDNAAQEIRNRLRSGSVDAYTLVFPDNLQVAGNFLITSLEHEGAHDGAINFSLTLESSGAITETAI